MNAFGTMREYYDFVGCCLCKYDFGCYGIVSKIGQWKLITQPLRSSENIL